MRQPVNNTANGNNMPSDLQTPLFSFSNELFLPQQHLQATSTPVNVSSVPQQHPQAATVSDEMILFNNLDSDAKMSRMCARLQALEQRAVEQTIRPHESTAEIVVSGLLSRGQLSYEEIVSRILNFIGAATFIGDVISIRKLNSAKENESSSTPNIGAVVLMSFSLILQFKSVQFTTRI